MSNRKARWRRPARTDPDEIQTEAPPNDLEAGSRKDGQSTGAKVNTTPRAEVPVMKRAQPGGVFSPRVMMPGYSAFLKWGRTSRPTCP